LQTFLIKFEKRQALLEAQLEALKTASGDDKVVLELWISNNRRFILENEKAYNAIKEFYVDAVKAQANVK